MPGLVRRIVTSVVALLATFTAAGALAPAGASAAPSWGCTAQPLSATALGAALPLSPIQANPGIAPCVTQSKSLLDLPPVVGLNASVLTSSTEITDAVIPDQTASASSQVEGLGLTVAGYGNVLSVDTASSSAAVQCVSGAPSYTLDSDFSNVRVLGIPVDLSLGDVDLNILALRARIQTNVTDVLPNGRRRVALRVRLTAVLDTVEVLRADIGVAEVDAVDSPCSASTAGRPPTVTVQAGTDNREVTAQTTPASSVAHDAVESCSIEARPSGSGGLFVPVVPTGFDPATGRCTAKLPQAGFPGPASYEVRATAQDHDGDVGTSPSISLAVVAPTVDEPTLSGRDLSAAVTPVPNVAISSCSYVLTPDGGGTPTTVPGTYSTATQTCDATVPASVADGAYDVTVTVTDANGDQGSNQSADALTLTGNAPTVALQPDRPNREILATTAAPTGESVVSCTIEVRPSGGGAWVPLTGVQLDPVTGDCSGVLPAGPFPPSDYEVRVTATDTSGDDGSDSGTITVAAPTVDRPTLSGRDLSATVTPAPGAAIASCAYSLAPTGGGPSIAVPGSYSTTTKTCDATVPASVNDGRYDVTVTVVDVNTDQGTNHSAGPLLLTGNLPTVALRPDQPNRKVLATTTAASGESVVDCVIEVRPSSGGAWVPLTGVQLDPATHDCSGVLPASQFPPQDYEVRVTVTDTSGDQATASGTITVAAPTVGTPILEDGTVVVPVTPVPGVDVTACELVITPAGGTPVTVAGTYDPATKTCRAPLPAGVGPGDATVVATVTDANGDTGSGTGTIVVPQVPAPPAPPTPPAPTPPKGDAPPPPPPASPNVFVTGSAADQIVACSKRPLVVTGVQRRGRKVALAGVAGPAFRGKRVEIVFAATGKTVARPTVSAGGTFKARVPAPSARVARTNRARYFARSGRTKSTALKLQRRMAQVAVSSKGGRVTFRGTVQRPLARRTQKVLLQRLVECGSYETVATAKVGRNGRYRLQARTPDGAKGVIYRARTRTASRPSGPANVRTFTLMFPVDLT